MDTTICGRARPLIPGEATTNSFENQENDYLERLIPEAEAARFLGLKVKTLQSWRSKGLGPRFIRLSARAIRYRRRDLIDFSEAQLVRSTAESGKGSP